MKSLEEAIRPVVEDHVSFAKLTADDMIPVFGPARICFFTVQPAGLVIAEKLGETAVPIIKKEEVFPSS